MPTGCKAIAASEGVRPTQLHLVRAIPNLLATAIAAIAEVATEGEQLAIAPQKFPQSSEEVPSNTAGTLRKEGCLG